MNKTTIFVRGTHCKSCEILLENRIRKVKDVKRVAVDYRSGRIEIDYSGEAVPTDEIHRAIIEAGYSVGLKGKSTWFSSERNDYLNLLWAAIILAVIYAIAKPLGLFSLAVNTASTGPWVALLVGLVAGVSTCMALVGGLVLALSARHSEIHPEAMTVQKFRPHLSFNLGRLIGFTIFGGLIGLIGSALSPSPSVLGLMTVVVGGVMIFLGLKLVEIFPILKDKTIALPKSLSRLLGIKYDTKEYSHSGAIISGALTFFLPCGFTQAMQLYAVSSGSFLTGALIMFLFALGTAPGLLGVGGLTAVFKGQVARRFFAVAGLTVIVLGLFNIFNGGRLLTDFLSRNNDEINNNSIVAGVQEIRMTQDGFGYSPSVLTVERGKKVRWIINSTNPFSCASSIVMSKYRIARTLSKGENVIEFTPTESGEIPFSCSMGMYRGKFIVIN